MCFHLREWRFVWGLGSAEDIMRRTADDRARQMRTGSGAAVQRAFPYLDDGGGEQRINRRTANTSWQLGTVLEVV